MKKLLLVVGLAAMLAAPQLASAQQWFDFNGQTLLPAGVGFDMTSYAIVENGGVDSPLPLDWDNYQYTLVITGLTLDGEAGDTQSYSGGSIVLYEDNATPADFSNPATFSDGTAILSGTFTVFNRTMFFPSLGSGQGNVNWTGGTRAGEFAPADLIGWSYVVTISNRDTVTLPGYDENWDGKVEPLEPVVPNAHSSFGQLKASRM